MRLEESLVGDKALGREFCSDKEIVDYLEKHTTDPLMVLEDGNVSLRFDSGCNSPTSPVLRKVITKILKGEL